MSYDSILTQHKSYRVSCHIFTCSASTHIVHFCYLHLEFLHTMSSNTKVHYCTTLYFILPRHSVSIREYCVSCIKVRTTKIYTHFILNTQHSVIEFYGKLAKTSSCDQTGLLYNIYIILFLIISVVVNKCTNVVK